MQMETVPHVSRGLRQPKDQEEKASLHGIGCDWESPGRREREKKQHVKENLGLSLVLWEQLRPMWKSQGNENFEEVLLCIKINLLLSPNLIV